MNARLPNGKLDIYFYTKQSKVKTEFRHELKDYKASMKGLSGNLNLSTSWPLVLFRP